MGLSGQATKLTNHPPPSSVEVKHEHLWVHSST